VGDAIDGGAGVFWSFLCMTSSKTPQKHFPKPDQKISKNLKKKGR
jgi:hypothetical protein